MFRSKRKPVDEIWKGQEIVGVTNIVQFAPSACNTQPWLVENSGTSLLVYRVKKKGLRGIMPASQVSYYNRIDIGIFLCFLDICMEKVDIFYDRNLFLY